MTFYYSKQQVPSAISFTMIQYTSHGIQINITFSTTTEIITAYASICNKRKVNLVILSVSSTLGVHQLSMWISEVTVAEFAVEARCSSRVIAAFLNVLQTLTHSFTDTHHTQLTTHNICNIITLCLTQRDYATTIFATACCCYFWFLFNQPIFHGHYRLDPVPKGLLRKPLETAE